MTTELTQRQITSSVANRIEEMKGLTDKRLNIIFNFPLDYRVDVKQHILD